MPVERLSDLANAFLRPQFPNWEIERSDGQVEPFDPLTLLSSLIESEIGLDDAILLYDDIIARVAERAEFQANTKEGDKLRLDHSEIHDIVATEILRSEKDLAPFWLSNYESMLSKDVYSLPATTDNFIDSRNAGSLKAEIISFLGRNHNESGNNAELRQITNRIIKLVRFRGFYKVNKKFLYTFLEALSSASTKAFMPRPSFSDTELVESLERIDRLLLVLQGMPPFSAYSRDRCLIGWGFFIRPQALISCCGSGTSVGKGMSLVRWEA